MSIPVQRASIAAWNDEQHVIDNRRMYQEKFERVIPILQQVFDVKLPDASFYIWLKVPDGDDLAFARNLWQKAAIKYCPDAFWHGIPSRGIPGKVMCGLLWLPMSQLVSKLRKPLFPYIGKE